MTAQVNPVICGQILWNKQIAVWASFIHSMVGQGTDQILCVNTGCGSITNGLWVQLLVIIVFMVFGQTKTTIMECLEQVWIQLLTPPAVPVFKFWYPLFRHVLDNRKVLLTKANPVRKIVSSSCKEDERHPFSLPVHATSLSISIYLWWQGFFLWKISLMFIY